MMEEKHSFVVSQENWSLHRKGYQDQKRHMDKVKDAIKNNLPDLVSEENIVTSDGRNIIKIPSRYLDEYQLRYNHEKSKHVGQGDGGSDVGDVIAQVPDQAAGQRKGPGKGENAGDEPGVYYYEAEVSIAEIEQILFDELELPN